MQVFFSFLFLFWLLLSCAFSNHLSSAVEQQHHQPSEAAADHSEAAADDTEHCYFSVDVTILRLCTCICSLLCSVFLSVVEFVGSLNGKNVVITGGSAGIGEQIAYHYARMGARILITSRTVDNLQKVDSFILYVCNLGIITHDLTHMVWLDTSSTALLFLSWNPPFQNGDCNIREQHNSLLMRMSINLLIVITLWNSRLLSVWQKFILQFLGSNIETCSELAHRIIGWLFFSFSFMLGMVCDIQV